MLVITMFPSGRRVGASKRCVHHQIFFGIQVIYGSLLLSRYLNLSSLSREVLQYLDNRIYLDNRTPL